jgi:hypothetical protein
VLRRKYGSKGDESEENDTTKILRFCTVCTKLFVCLIEDYVRQTRQVACMGHINTYRITVQNLRGRKNNGSLMYNERNILK